MEHREDVRIVPDADTAVLFMHGICGSPKHYRDVIPLTELVPEEWSIYNVCLDGHGGSVDDFAASSMKKWRAQVFHIFDDLCRSHERVIIVAHSMGTLFAMQMACKAPEKVAFLFLLAAPMRPWPRLMGVKNLLKMTFGKLREDVPMEQALNIASGITVTKKIWKYVKWAPRFIELFAEIYRTKKVLPQLRVPCVAWQSKRDEMVANRSAKVLCKAASMDVRVLTGSTHFYYAPEDRELLCADFSKRIEKLKKQD